MARIAITGASGNVGRAILPPFREDHDVTAFSHSEHDDLDTVPVDIADHEAVVDALADFDVIVHLAAKSTDNFSWEEIRSANIDGARNVFEAAEEGDAHRVVFASTNNAVQMYNQRPEGGTVDHPTTVRPDAIPRPNSYYGVSKAAGEALGNYFADCHGLEVVNVRIGWLDCEPFRNAIERGDRYAYAMYLSERDCRDGLLKAATAELHENPLTVNLVSRNQDRYLSIGEAMRQLGYEPQDDSRGEFGRPDG
jgi:L-arabinose 1-dehydrogenase [NAD(P)+]